MMKNLCDNCKLLLLEPTAQEVKYGQECLCGETKIFGEREKTEFLLEKEIEREAQPV